MDKTKRINGFDYLRVILCFSVIALHTNIFNVPNQYVGTDPTNPIFYRIILYNLFWCAVPAFYSLSLFLYIKNRDDNKNYFNKRFLSLLLIYIFWAVVEYALMNNGSLENIELSKWGIFQIISSNTNIAYYLFNLLYLTAFTEIIIRLIQKAPVFKYAIISIGLITSCILMFFGSGILNKIFNPDFQLGSKLGFSNPLLFLSYIFASFIIYELYKNQKYINPGIALSFILWFLIAIADWFIRINVSDLAPINYESLGRPSLVFESIFLILVFMKIKIKKVSRTISVLSGLSLSIYLIHPIVLKYIGINQAIYNVPLNGYIIFLLTLIITTVFSLALKNIKGLI